MIPLALFGYAYVGYPFLLRMLSLRSRRESTAAEVRPSLTITVPVYNEAEHLGATLDGLLALDYPADRRHILVLSDASTDGTDDVVRSFGDRGIELCRMTQRRGKTAAENASVDRITGDIVVNIDATIGLEANSLSALVAVFADPTVGVASGRDISVGDVHSKGNRGESSYVGYEMRVRALETQAGSIVGASGCFYAMRRELHAIQFPDDLSRDFGAVLVARASGFRSVSVNEAVCYVPRTTSLRQEYRRKVRTMARGLRTLWYQRGLLNPLRYGRFAWMLTSHKLCRWLIPLSLPPAMAGLVLVGMGVGGFGWLPLVLALVCVAVGALGLAWPFAKVPPTLVAAAGYALAGNLAGLEAWVRAPRGRGNQVWEPTRRHSSHPGETSR